MGPDTRDAIQWTLGTFLTACTIVALATRFVLLPWLREHLVLPVRETRRQVADNGHVNEAHPTIPDRLEDLSGKVDEATAAHADQARDMKALSRVLDEHLSWADRWVDVVERERELMVEELRALKQRIHHEENGDDTT